MRSPLEPKLALAPGLLRRRRFTYAIAASGVSKLLALATQLLAMPLALHALGTDRYAGFLALQSFLSWTGLCGFGLSYSLPKYLAAAQVSGDHEGERALVMTSLGLMFAACLVLVLLLSVLGFVIPPAKLVAAITIPQAELNTAYFAAVAINALLLFAMLDLPLRGGYQEFHRSSICSSVASVGVLLGLLAIAMHGASIAMFIAVIYLPLSIAMLVDMELLLRKRSYLRHGPVQVGAALSKIALPSGNAMAYQVQFALVLYLPTLVVAHLTNASQTAAFGSLLQIAVLGVSSFNLLLQPLSSAMADAHAHGDNGWISCNHARAIVFVIAIGGASILAAATIGPFVIHLWLGPSIKVSRLLAAASAACFLGMVLIQLEFYILSAIGTLRGVGIGSALMGLLALGLGSFLCSQVGIEGMPVGLSFVMALSAIWLWSQVRRTIAAQKES